MSEAPAALLAGEVRCLRLQLGMLELRGRDRAGGLPLSIRFASAQVPTALPALLRDASLREATPRRPDRSGLRVWELSAAGQSWRIVARNVQVHLDPARAFYAALPLPKASVWQRCKWALLLNLLRLPFVSALLPAARR